MSKQGNPNPLFEPQREKVGSDTYSKYSYQYHWALYRILKEHENNREYAVFVELHEDVVLSDSLDVTKAKFEFNQIKDVQAKYTVQSICQRKKNSNSVLGKLIISGTKERYKKKVTKINLITTSGFDFGLKTEGVDLQVISISDVDNFTFKSLTSAIKKELQVANLPVHLNFVLSDLPNKNYKENVIAQISILINNLLPGTFISPVDIYRALWDDIDRKGKIKYDYQNWEDALSNKALTSTKVTQVIEAFSHNPTESENKKAFDAILDELNFTVLKTKKLKDAYYRYKQMALGQITLEQKQRKDSISKNLKIFLSEQTDPTMIQIVSGVKEKLTPKIKSSFPSDLEIDAAIIYEIIIQGHA